MSIKSLAALAEFATSNNNASRKGNPIYLMTVEEARNHVQVKDGNKKPLEDGGQALTLTLGKYTMVLTPIKAKSTRLNVTADKVEETTALLLAAVAEGTFDEDIVVAQAKGDPANKPAPKVAAAVEGEEPVGAEAPAAVDLDELG